MDLWNKVSVANTDLELVFVEMIFEVIGKGGIKEKENGAREEEKKQDNLGKVAYQQIK